MNKNEVFEKVGMLITQQLKNCNVEDIKMETRLIEDLGADSLDVVEITFAIEEEFKIQVDNDAAAKIQKVDDIVNYILEIKK